MNRGAFFSALRKRNSGVFGTSLSQGAVDGLETIIEEGMERGTPLEWLAYILATAYHETAHTMQPIREFGRGRGRKYGKPVAEHGNQVAYGRGYVQLTWSWNYQRADRELKLGGKLIANYDMALNEAVAGRILFQGMEQGWFTGKKLADYIRPAVSLGPGIKELARVDYVGARKIINGTDRARLIAGYASAFEAALRTAGYGASTTA
ncbi:MAG TPA: hypothetical protein VFR36_05555 [Sphingomicrobium sp.]|nr:hypothetical protein [Sphingomicrobium sp.]